MTILPNVNQMLENRQLKLLHTQRRHLRSKVSAILSSWSRTTHADSCFDCFNHQLRWVRCSGGGAPAQQHVFDKTYYVCTEALPLDMGAARGAATTPFQFQSSLFFPLDARCAARLGMRAGPTVEEAERRALGACLSLLPTAADWQRVCRAWDSDLFEELSRTAAALNTALVFSLDLQDQDRGQGASAAAAVVATISGALPAWTAAEVQCGTTGDDGASTVVCVARETGPSLRDALKLAMVAAIETLGARVETEWRARAQDAAHYCRSCALHATGATAEAAHPLATAALFAALPGGTAVWRPYNGKSNNHIRDTAVRWTVRAGPHADEVTVQLPSRENPFTPLTWHVAVPHIPPVRCRRAVVPRHPAGPLQLRRTGVYGWPRAVLPFVALTQLAEKLSRVGLYAALRCPSLWQPPHSVERFLYDIEAEGGRHAPTATLSTALTAMKDERPSDAFVPSLLRALLPEDGPPGPRTAAALRWAREPLSLLPQSPLFVVLAQGGERPRWASVPHPHRHFLQGVVAGCLAAFLASDAVVRGDSTMTAGEVALTATSTALRLSLPLYTHKSGRGCTSCALLRYVAERCVFSPPRHRRTSTVALPSPPSRRHEAALVPDVLALLDEVRRARDLPSSSFPTIGFAQKARHDPARRFHELRAGLPGDVDVYTRVTLRWEEAEPEWSAKAVSDPELHHRHRGGTASPTSSCYALRDTGAPRGPLPLLLAVVLALHRRVFPARDRPLPLLEVRSPTSRRGLDFLLYTWFGASPQIRTFDILSAAGWQQEAEHGEGRLPGGTLDGAVRQAVDKTMVRAMLFYDLLGQRVLFAETHDVLPARAVARVERCSIELNLRLESSDHHLHHDRFQDREGKKVAATSAAALRPFRSVSLMQLCERERQHLRRLCAPSAGSTSSSPYERACARLLAGRSRPYLSELGALVTLLQAAELGDADGTALAGVHFSFSSRSPQPPDGAVEGVLTLRVAGAPAETVRVSSHASSGSLREGGGGVATQVWPGVVPAAVHLAQRALQGVLGGDHADLCRACEQCRPVLGRDDYPPYSASFYHPPRLLGELLQGIAGKYDCTYEHLNTLKGDAHEAVLCSMASGVDADRSPPSGSDGPRTTFFAAERHEVRGQPDWVAPLQIVCRLTIASLVGCTNSAVSDSDGNATPFLLGRGVGRSRREAWVAAARQALQHNFPALHAQLEAFRQLSEWRMDPVALTLLGAPHGLRLQWSASLRSCALRILAASPPTELAASTAAPDAETAFIDAVGLLEQRLQRARQQKRAAAAPMPYAAWTPESHYAKSLWHALCGGLSASMGGSRVRLYFEIAAPTGTAPSVAPPPFAAVHVVQHLVLPHPKDGLYRPVRRTLLSLSCAEVGDYLGGPDASAHSPAALLMCAVPAALHALFCGSAPEPPLSEELQRLLDLHAREVARTCRRSRHFSASQQAHALLVACTGCRADVIVTAADEDGWRAEAWLQLPCYVDVQADAQWQRVLVAAHTGRTSDRAVTGLCKELVAEAERLGKLISSFSQSTT